MLSRAYTTSSRKGRDKERAERISSRSKTGTSPIQEYEDCIGDDVQLDLIPRVPADGVQMMTMKEVLRSSVGVMGESRLGLTDKVVLFRGDIFAVKRFRRLTVNRKEFGRRVERLAHLGRQCEHLVPTTAYLYAKRIKFVLCHYYPMGSLADLLAGGRKLGHTALSWCHRLKIILDIAGAICFIHTQCPPSEGSMRMNAHGNIKSSNVMINIDFSACLSDYGFTQLAERVDDQLLQKIKSGLLEDLSQKSDIFNFGLIVVDALAGSRFNPEGFAKSLVENEKKESLDQSRELSIPECCFEFDVRGRERRKALQVFDVALACLNPLPEARPSIHQILLLLGVGDVAIK